MSTTSPLLDNENRVTTKQEPSKLIEHMLMIPFSQNNFLQYTKSLTQLEKIELVKLLKLDLFKKWSDLLFIKKLSLALKKINSDATLMKQLITLLSKKIIQPEPTLDNYEQSWEQYVKEHHYWSVYWSVYYHSERINSETSVQEILNKLQEYYLISNENKALTISTLSHHHEQNDKFHVQQKNDKKIMLLEAKANKETQLRIQMEQELAKLEKLNRTNKQEMDKQKQTSDQLKHKFNEALKQIEKQEQIIEAVQRKKRDEEERWLQERLNLLQQIKQLADESKKQQQLVEQYSQQLEESKKQIASLTQSNNQLQKQKTNTKLEHERTFKLIAALQYKLHKRLDKTNQSLVKNFDGQYTQLTSSDKLNTLNYLKETIDLIEHTERYLQFETNETQSTTNQASTNVVETIATTEEAGVYGTFYRRDHGGYIELEEGESFNISESLVQQLELQHEAEVLCIPNQHSGKHSHYTIKIEFQGDDAYSPITQYDGYVYVDSENKWYCVDMNDESRKFPIHFKDVDIQKPSPGDPCTFNVANDGYIARLTKLYRLQPGESYESTFTTKKAEKAKTATPPVTKEKREQYLAGCTITIIGGQRKWFESVVKETGAELVHNGGERPERIATDLARSQALFMILTSTSHRATWEGVEIAKANQIPHFTIQGSKSNLRSLLWENQQLIRETNR